MSEENSQPGVVRSIWQTDFTRRWIIRIVALCIAFLLGFVPMWLSSRENARGLAQTQVTLKRLQMQSTLASAAIDARRGEFERARQTVSSFFTEVAGELNSPSSVYGAEEKTKVGQLLSGRDEIITLLSRGDPAGAERLSALFVQYRDAVNSSK